MVGDLGSLGTCERRSWTAAQSLPYLWMMCRSGWATKPGQERILCLRIAREGFEWALAHGCLSHFEPGTYASREEWLRCLGSSPVRIQWDPVQVGLAGEASRRFVHEWITDLEDVTSLAHDLPRPPGRGTDRRGAGEASRRASLPAGRPAPGHHRGDVSEPAGCWCTSDAPAARSNHSRAPRGAGQAGTSTTTRSSSGDSTWASRHGPRQLRGGAARRLDRKPGWQPGADPLTANAKHPRRWPAPPVGLSSALQEHDGVGQEPVLVQELVEGVDQGPDERSILGERLG